MADPFPHSQPHGPSSYPPPFQSPPAFNNAPGASDPSSDTSAFTIFVPLSTSTDLSTSLPISSAETTSGTLPFPNSAPSNPAPSAGAIAGGVIGGLVLLFGLVTAFLVIRRRIRDGKGGAYTQTRSGPTDRGLSGVNMVGAPRFPRRAPTDNSSMQEGLLDEAERGIQRPKYWLSGSESRQSVYAGEEFDPDTLMMDAAHHDPKLYTHEGSPSGSTSTISFDTVRGEPTPTQAQFQPAGAAGGSPPLKEHEEDIYLGEQLTSAFKRPILGSVSSSLTASSSYSGTSTDDWSSDGSKSWIPVTTPTPGSEQKGFRLDGYDSARNSGVTLRDARASGSGQMSVNIQQSSLLDGSDQGYVDLGPDEDDLR